METEKRIDDIHTHIYIYTEIIYSSGTNRKQISNVTRCCPPKESKLSVRLISDSWPLSYAFSFQQLFQTEELYNFRRTPSRLCIRRYLFPYVINSKASRHATRSHFCANRLDETTRHERETRD